MRKFVLQLSLAGLLIIGLAVTTSADTDALIRSLKPTGFVNDYAGVLSQSERAQLENALAQHARQTGVELSVVSLKSLEGGEINDTATRLFEAWGLGQKGRDNGLLLLAAMKERKLRIEVGYGLEGVLPDAVTGRILDTYVVPEFRAGRPGQGLTQGALALIQKTGGQAGAPPASRRAQENSPFEKLVSLIFIIAFVLFAIRHPWLALMLLSSGGGRSRGGGFGGGGFGGFGGGLSGGGGASRGW